MDFNLGRIARNMTRNLFGTDIIANNLANTSTTGFKRDAAFTDAYMEAVQQGASKSYTNFSQGEMIHTANSLDFAITGTGFFVVQTELGLAVTRNGHFQVDAQGMLETAAGELVLGEHGPMSIIASGDTPGQVLVTRQGELYVDDVFIDTLAIAQVADLQALEKIGSNLFKVGNDILMTQLDQELIDIRQGMLEGSNVLPVVEMVTMIDLQRNYESTQRVVKAMDQILGRAIQLGEYR
ncbi:MAG: flagellar hook-basal body protein [Candidatus Marinimicrobia bacterium]|nr:flagellar hook-basal body protein [Candidatus Neomarinimicrobiota bacterium]